MGKDMCMATCLLAIMLFVFGFAFQSWTTYCVATELSGSKDPVCVGESADYKKTEIAMFTASASVVGLMLVYMVYKEGSVDQFVPEMFRSRFGEF